MSEEFEKLGRKRSNDPAQESLRQAKDTWNQEVKSLIAGLIAFKRGMNGRGDPKAGLPPSSIKDPLPPQIGQFLNGLATQYSKIIDDAKKIVDAQTYYSTHRRKRSPKTQQPAQPEQQLVTTTALIEPSLIAQGSWWGSRAWAHIALLRKIDKYNRRLRLKMLAAGVELRRDLKNFEYKLAERDVNSTPAGLTILAGIASEYLAVFLRMYDKLEVIYKEKEELSAKLPKVDTKKTEEKTAPPKKSDEPAAQEPVEVQAPVAQPVEVQAPAAVAPTPVVSSNLLEDFRKIYAQLVKIEVVLKHVFSLPTADKTNFRTMKRSFSKFLRDVHVLNDLSGRSDHDKSVVEIEKLIQDIINQYKYLLQTATNVLGPASNFDELANKIPKPKISEVLEIVQGHDILKKEAASSVSNWLNKMWMSINPDNIDRMKLELIDSVPPLRQSLDSLMDSLEDKNSELDVLSGKVSDASQKFDDLLEQAISLAQNYMIAARRQEKGKNYYLADIKISDIRILKELRTDIRGYIKD